MRTELEQERRMAASDRFGDASGETARRLEDIKRRRKREQSEREENNGNDAIRH